MDGLRAVVGDGDGVGTTAALIVAQKRRIDASVVLGRLSAPFEVAHAVLPAVAGAAGDRATRVLALIAIRGGALPVRLGHVTAGDVLEVEELPAPLRARLVRRLGQKQQGEDEQKMKRRVHHLRCASMIERQFIYTAV